MIQTDAILRAVIRAQTAAQQTAQRMTPADLAKALAIALADDHPQTEQFNVDGSVRLGLREAFDRSRWDHFGQGCARLAAETEKRLRKERARQPVTVTVAGVAGALGAHEKEARAALETAAGEGFVSLDKGGAVELLPAGKGLLAGTGKHDDAIRAEKARQRLGL